MKKLIYETLKRLNPLGHDVERLKEQMTALQAFSLPAILEQEVKRLEALEVRPPAHKPGDPFKVVHVNTCDNLGGAAIAAWRLHKGLEARGHSSSVIVKEKFSGEDSVAVAYDRKKDTLFEDAARREGWLYWNVLSTFSFPSIKEFAGADIVHFNNLHGDFFNPFALPGLTRLKPAIWTLHDMQSLTGHCAYSMDCGRWESGCGDCPLLNDYPSLEKDSTALLWNKKMEQYKRSDFDIAVPSEWLKDIVERSILSGRKVHLVKYGLDTDTFKPLPKDGVRKKLGLNASDLVCVTSAHGGRGNVRKGGAYFMDALKIVSQGRKIKAVSIGDSERPPAIAGVDWINTGHIAGEGQIAEWYSAADLFVCPSLADNSPLAIIEAMACGVPTVAFTAGGIPELVAHMKTGYLARYKDTDDLARGISLFLSEKGLRESAGRAARAEAERSHTAGKMTEAYLDIYESLVERRKGMAASQLGQKESWRK